MIWHNRYDENGAPRDPVEQWRELSAAVINFSDEDWQQASVDILRLMANLAALCKQLTVDNVAGLIAYNGELVATMNHDKQMKCRRLAAMDRARNPDGTPRWPRRDAE